MNGMAPELRQGPRGQDWSTKTRAPRLLSILTRGVVRACLKVLKHLVERIDGPMSHSKAFEHTHRSAARDTTCLHGSLDAVDAASEVEGEVEGGSARVAEAAGLTRWRGGNRGGWGGWGLRRGG